MLDVRENERWEAERQGESALLLCPSFVRTNLMTYSAECLRLQLKIAKEDEEAKTAC